MKSEKIIAFLFFVCILIQINSCHLPAKLQSSSNLDFHPTRDEVISVITSDSNKIAIKTRDRKPYKGYVTNDTLILIVTYKIGFHQESFDTLRFHISEIRSVEVRRFSILWTITIPIVGGIATIVILLFLLSNAHFYIGY